jgi:hypothetical protein
MLDADGALFGITECRNLIHQLTKSISVRYELADRGSIAPEDLDRANDEDRKRIHELALEMTNLFQDLSDDLETGGVLPGDWRDARKPTF